MEKFKKEFREQLKAKKFLDQIVKDIPEATEAEAKAFYDQNGDKFTKPEMVTASHILITVDPSDSDEVKAEKKAKLEALRKDILSGKISFEDAAKANSDCPSKEQGGNLGEFAKGQMVPEFEMAAFTQEKGEIGEVIETQYGYHIIKVTDHKPAKKVSFEEAKKQIIDYLTGKKKHEKVTAYLKNLHDSATIKEFPKADAKTK